MTDGVTEPVEVVRIIRRSTQGVTLPFLCEVSDGRLFWAKGSLAGRRALCCEWIAGCLAKELDLPIPPFAQLFVPRQLVEQSLIESVRELGEGIVFGSQDVGDVQEFGVKDASSVLRHDAELATRTLLFDWWIQNGDRSLGEKGGNPNILVSMSDGNMRIIDHNIAFDRTWNAAQFFDQHVFANVRRVVAHEHLLAIREEMRQVRKEVSGFYSQIPDSWHLDADHAANVDLTDDEVCGILNRVETEWDATWS